MKGLFVSASIVDLKRRYLSIVDYFKSRDSSFEAVFINVNVASMIIPDMEAAAYEAITSKGYKIENFTSFNRNKIRKKIQSVSPDFALIDSMNVYNMLWNCLYKENHVPIYFYPHGFMIENLHYTKSGVLSKVKKVTRYTYGLYNLSKLLDKPFLKLFKSYTQYISKGADMCGSDFDDPKLHPDFLFTYSDYYKDYFKRKYAVRDVRCKYIMPSDFTLVEKVLAEPEDETGVCYITQTLVEDARYNKDEFEELLKSLRPVAEAVDKLYVKLHPRVESKMYDKAFEGLSNVEIVRDFPHCKCYFTHYSSMSYTSALVSGKTIIYELPGQPTDKVFQEVATEIVYDVPGLVSALKRQLATPELPFEERKKIISKYATYTGISPYEELYNTICGK